MVNLQSRGVPIDHRALLIVRGLALTAMPIRQAAAWGREGLASGLTSAADLGVVSGFAHNMGCPRT
jgi:hypothetical protein